MNTTTSKNPRLGIVQTRGLGDIVIALPIADHYRRLGWDIYWPVEEQWVDSLNTLAPWVRWIPVTADQGAFFYDEPMLRLKNFKCDEIICLYQSLSHHPEFTQEPWFQQTSFDEYKYIRAQVPFLKKWQLSQCITRSTEREQALYDRIITGPKYAVVHLTGSDHRAQFDYSTIPEDWQTVTITEDVTDNPFDWLLILERAEVVVLVDSLFSNLVDQLQMPGDKYFLPRSHIGLTPVLGMDWTWLDNPNIAAHTRIFRGG
jgi:hypothetical protein